MQNLYTKKLIVDDTELDYNYKVPLTELMRLIESAAFDHSDMIGIDHKTMREESKAFWVVGKIKLVLKGEIQGGDKISVSTWTHPLGMVRANRDFMIKANRSTKVKGTSEWCCLDYETRKVRKLSSIAYPDLDMVATDYLKLDFTNLKLDFSEKDLAYTRKIRSTDIDINNHTNNLKYNFIALDSFSVEEMREMDIKEYEIYFVNESRESEEISVYKKKYKNYYYIEGRTNDKCVFRVVIKYSKKKAD